MFGQFFAHLKQFITKKEIKFTIRKEISHRWYRATNVVTLQTSVSMVLCQFQTNNHQSLVSVEISWKHFYFVFPYRSNNFPVIRIFDLTRNFWLIIIKYLRKGIKFFYFPSFSWERTFLKVPGTWRWRLFEWPKYNAIIVLYGFMHLYSFL